MADGAKIVGNRIAIPPSGSGISTFSSDSVVVAKNVVVGDGSSSLGTGISLHGTGSSATGNVVVGAGTGLILEGTGIKATGNLAIGNRDGFRIDISATAGAPAKFDKNAAIANLDAGLFVFSTDNPSGGATVALGRSNVFANGERSGLPTPNCGIRVHNNDATDSLTVSGTGLFWGVAGGPGANPADAIGGGCNPGSGVAIVIASSPAPNIISIKPPAQR